MKYYIYAYRNMIKEPDYSSNPYKLSDGKPILFKDIYSTFLNSEKEIIDKAKELEKDGYTEISIYKLDRTYNAPILPREFVKYE